MKYLKCCGVQMKEGFLIDDGTHDGAIFFTPPPKATHPIPIRKCLKCQKCGHSVILDK